MADTRTIPWWKADQQQSGLSTDLEHDIVVQREAIPLVFVPGIMGTRLRRSGTSGTGTGTNGLPNLRWDPGDGGFMWKHYIGAGGAERRRLVVGEPAEYFDPGFLEVDNTNPVRDGFYGIMKDYTKFLNPLKNHDWGDLAKIFEFPVYAVGYNWSDSNENSGRKLVDRIKEIIAEAKDVTGLCEKVILITHSMGGIVSRAASELAGGRSLIIGIVHGVQPVTGAPAAYWRMKAGFEGTDSLGMVQKALGNNGPKVTAVLGNIPGGLQLLPTKNHRNNHNQAFWLTLRNDDGVFFTAPKHGDPYEEIYRVKAVVEPANDDAPAPSGNAYWGLVDPALLNPAFVPPSTGNAHDALDAAAAPAADPWDKYLEVLKIAETFHDKMGLKMHPYTLCLRGTGHDTADTIELRVERRMMKRTSYPNQGFRGYFTDDKGKHRVAVLQDPSRQSDGTGDGDGTVVLSSAAALDKAGRPDPGDQSMDVEHQPAYESGAVQEWAFNVIRALCKLRYYEKHGGS